MLNKQGIRDLAADLVANGVLYNQRTFGDLIHGGSECHTEACMAGFCLIREIGLQKFEALLKLDEADHGSRVPAKSFAAGKKQLGVKPRGKDGLELFCEAVDWPYDLQLAYGKAKTHRTRARVAIHALQRLLPDGTIDKNRKAIHTPLKRYLNKLERKRKAA